MASDTNTSGEEKQAVFAELKLKAHEERRIRAGHHWIYSNEVDSATPLKSFNAGDHALVVDSKGQAVGTALIDPNNLICARLVSRQKHQPLDKSLFVHRLKIAMAWREKFYSEPSYRLAYGDSDFLPGFVIDRFGDYCVVQSNSIASDQLIEPLIEALIKVVKPKGILVKSDSQSRQQAGLPVIKEVMYGEVPAKLEIIENNTKFIIDPHYGQKTGWFYDHRENRKQIQTLVKGKRILDVFSYTGAWGLQSLSYGAEEVMCIDSSEPALDLLHESAELNSFSDKVSSIQGDAQQAMAELRKQGEHFDVVIVDPPAFIKRKKDFKNGLIGYRKAYEAALKLLKKDGVLVAASCSMHLEANSFRDCLLKSSRHVDRFLQIAWQGGLAPDHPVHPAISETAYLKMAICHVTMQS